MIALLVKSGSHYGGETRGSGAVLSSRCIANIIILGFLSALIVVSKQASAIFHVVPKRAEADVRYCEELRLGTIIQLYPN